MTPMKSLQEWAADCIAQHLLHSMCVTQLATSAFRGQIGSSQKEIIARTLVCPDEPYFVSLLPSRIPNSDPVL
ncbi:hypothetical protein Hamer_G005841, partial [Homarus americanus]